VAFESQPCINYKIKHKSKEDFIVYFVNLGSNLYLVIISSTLKILELNKGFSFVCLYKKN
jgi:hypothetical protein